VLDELIALHGRPAAVRVDNGPELLAQVFVDWCRDRGIAVHYIQPGKPDQNAYIERFNRSYRTEILDAYFFESLAEVQALTERWRLMYNHERSHDSLDRVPPLMFLASQHRRESLLSHCLLDGEAYAVGSTSMWTERTLSGAGSMC
jgi:putative transposase